MQCKFCNRIITNAGSLSSHQKRCKLNPHKIETIGFKSGNVPWNKGLVGDSRLTHSLATKKQISDSLKGKSTGRASSEEKERERIQKVTEKAKANNGGYRHGSGRGKKGWYKGFFCDSSWELAYLIYHLDHNIHIERCNEVRYYVWKGKQKRYYPDFVVEGKIVEIKGYITHQWEAKHKANPDIFCLYSSDMSPYLKYVIEKYGKDYIKLYEKKNGELAESGIAPDLKSEILSEPRCVGSNPTLAAKSNKIAD